MSFTTNVPQPTLGPVGFIAPDDQAILAGVQADQVAAFGSAINPALNTPQGQLATSTTAIISDSYSQFVDLSNQMDPAFNDGRFQDGIARIYFLTRDPAEPTALQVSCGGYPGVVIPVGALISDAGGNVYSCTAAGTIGASGTVVLGFANQVPGPIAVPGAEDVQIYQTIPQWNTVAVVSGEVGQDTETRAAFEARREATVAANGQGFLDSISGAVFEVPGVLSVRAAENFTGSPVVIQGVTLKPHSLYVAAYGGSSQAIAEAIWIKKDPGCDYNGNTTVEVLDTNPAYTLPYPSYDVTFEIPAAVGVCVNVTIDNNPGVPSNALTLIQNAVVGGFNGTDGGTRAGIGSTIFASRYVVDVQGLGPWALIEAIQVGSNASADCKFTGAINVGATLTVSAITSGTVGVGDFVYGAGVASGTIILAQTSGTTGSTGTYTVAVGQAVTGESMSCVSASRNFFTLDMDLMPTLAAADVNLILG